MALYLYQASYTADSLAAQIKAPKDRLQVVKPAVESAGAKMIAGGYCFGDSDVVAIFEAPNDVTAAAIALAFGAGGAIRSAKTTKLLSGADWVKALKKAQTVSPRYRPAR